MMSVVALSLIMCVSQPQLQFKSYALDLKFQPTYLVIVSQAKLVLSGAVNFFSTSRYAVNCLEKDVTTSIIRESLQLIFVAAVIASFLAWYTWRTQPCLVPEFNEVRTCTLAAASACLLSSIVTYAVRQFILGEAARYVGILLIVSSIGVLLYIAGRALWRMLQQSSWLKVEPERDISSESNARQSQVKSNTNVPKVSP